MKSHKLSCTGNSTNQVDLKKESRQLPKEISTILPKFDFIYKLPNKYDLIKLEDIRYKLSMVKFQLQDYIKYKNQKGW